MHLPSGLKVKDKLLYWYDSLFFPFAIMLQFSVPFSKAAGMPIISRRITGVIVCLSMTPFGRLKKSDDYKTRHVWKALPNNNGSIHTQKSRCTQIIHHSLYSQHARGRERERERNIWNSGWKKCKHFYSLHQYQLYGRWSRDDPSPPDWKEHFPGTTLRQSAPWPPGPLHIFK